MSGSSGAMKTAALKAPGQGGGSLGEPTVFVVPASGGRAPVVAAALVHILAAVGVGCEQIRGRRGAIALHLTGSVQDAGEAAREVLPRLLEQLQAASAQAAARYIDGLRYGQRLPREQAAAASPAFRASFTEAWGQAVADLVRNLPAPTRQGRLSSDPRDAAAILVADFGGAVAGFGAAIEHARDLRGRIAGRLGRPLRFAPAGPLGRRQEPFWSVEIFLRADGPGAHARLGLLDPLLPVLRADLDAVDHDGRAAIHTRLTGRRNAVRAAADLLPVLLQAAEDSADPAGDVPGYLADFGRAAASRLVSALSELPGSPRDRHTSTPSRAAEQVDLLPVRLFQSAAECFGARAPLPATAPLTIRSSDDPRHDVDGVDAEGRLTVEVAPGPVRGGAKMRVQTLTELGQALGVTVTRLGPVEADKVPGPNGLPQPELWRERVLLAGPPLLLRRLVELTAAAVPATEFAAAAAVSRRDRKLDFGANADISRAVDFRMFCIAAARDCARRLARTPAPAAAGADPGEAVADRIEEQLRAAAALRDTLDGAHPGPDASARLVVIPCGARKADQAMPAGLLYTGPYHRAARRAADAIAAAAPGTCVLILSALHGLLDPATVIAPYEQRMGRPGSVTAAQVAAQARDLGLADAQVTVLAGRAYADVVKAVWPDARDLLAGAGGLGRQLARLSALAATSAAENPA